MRVPKFWMRTLLGCAILLVCLMTGHIPVKANSGTLLNSYCTLDSCIYMSQTQTNGLCIFRSGGSCDLCTPTPGSICQYDDVQYGTLNCLGYYQNVYPLTRCFGSYPCCQ